MAAIRQRDCPGLKQFEHQVIDRPQIRALAQALEQAGIRLSQKSRRVGDFLLEQLLSESSLGIYQDWNARHATLASTHRIARIYLVSRQATPHEREIIWNAAVREFGLLDRLDHPGVLKADPPTECEYGPVLFLRQQPNAVSLNRFLSEERTMLTVDQRLGILRQIGEMPSSFKVTCPHKVDGQITYVSRLTTLLRFYILVAYEDPPRSAGFVRRQV